jgi:hypothetical protein
MQYDIALAKEILLFIIQIHDPISNQLPGTYICHVEKF